MYALMITCISARELNKYMGLAKPHIKGCREMTAISTG